MPIIRVRGSGRDRGRQVAEILGPLMIDGVNRWLDSLGEARATSPKPYLRKFLDDTSFEHACRRLMPDVMQEIAGMADVLPVAEDILFASQLHDEEWLYARDAGSPLHDDEAEKCSSLGVNDDAGGPTIIAQNMDIGAWADGLQILSIHEGDEQNPAAAYFSNAGNIGLCGLNSAGIGICCNTLMQLDYSRKGLPVAFVVRGVLRQRNFEDVERFLRSIEHASGQNYLVGAPGRIASFECSSSSVTEFTPYPDLDRTYHTNHALRNTDQRMVMERFPDKSSVERSGSPTTARRLATLETHLSSPDRSVGVQEIKTALSSREDPDGPISREARKAGEDTHIGFTFGSLIMELSTPPVLHIAAGPPSVSPYKTLHLF